MKKLLLVLLAVFLYTGVNAVENVEETKEEIKTSTNLFSESDKSAVNNYSLNKIKKLLLKKGFLKKSDKPFSIKCSGGTGHDSWAIIEKADGSFWAIPSMNQQEAGNLPKEISGSMAQMMCQMAIR